MADSQAPEKAAETPAAPTPPVSAAPPPPRWMGGLARRPFALLALLGLLLWLPGVLTLPALDRDESRFAQSSRQMVESGNVVDIRFGHVPRYKKPIGIYWLQAGATAMAGWGDDSHIWTYRLPSLLGAIAAAWLTVWCALAFAGAEVALLGGLLMLGTVLLAAEASIATTDAVLLACVLGVQGVLIRVWRAARDPKVPPPSTATVLWGWAAVAAGVLVKFPVVPGVALATVLALVAWTRQWRWLGSLKLVRGLLLTAVLVTPWLAAIAIQSHGAFFQQSLGNDFAAKVAGGQESHGAPPGYYLLLSTVCLFPAVLFVASGILQGIARRADPCVQFLLAWSGAWWFLVEAVPTKLPHYILPAYPALAILAAQFVLEPVPVRGEKVARWVGVVQFVIGAALLTAAPILLPSYFGDGTSLKAHWPLLAGTGIGALAVAAALILLALRKIMLAATISLLAMLAFVPTLTALLPPRLPQLWVTERLKPLVAAASRPDDPPPALAGYQEPSMVFALGKDVLLSNGAGAADSGARNGGLALVDDTAQGEFLARLAELQADADRVGEVSGFNYSRGRKVHVTLYRMTQLHDVN